MKPTSAPPQGRVPWQDLLLAVSLLTLWNPPTTAQVTVESVPPSATEGKDVLLQVHNLPRDTGRFNWYKGATTEENLRIVSYILDSQKTVIGPAHSGRETVYPNGSLLFQNITLNDTGVYTLQIINRTYETVQVTGQLHVSAELPKPHITSNNSNPVENVDSVLLTCEPQTQNTSYLWSVSNKSLPASTRLELSLDNRTLTIHGVTRDDTGPYVCATWNPVSDGCSDPFTLNVLYGPDAPTISPSDSYYHPGANLNLSCHAASNPPAQYSWLINGRPQTNTQELFIPNITANDSGSYTCLASNSDTRLNKTTVKIITVSEPLAQPSLHASNTTLTEDDSVFLTCSTNNTGVSIRWLFDGQSLKLTERMTLSQDNSTLTIHPVRKEDAGNYQCEVSNPGDSSKSDPVRLVVKGALTQLNPGLAPGVIAGIVIGVLAGVAVIVTLVYFLFIRKTGGANDLRDVTEHKPSASNHSQDHSDNLSKSEEVAYSSLNFSAHEPKKTTSASPSPADTETKSQHAEQKGRTGEGEATYFPTSLLLDTVSLWLLRKGFHSILLDIMLCLRGPSKRASWEFCALRYLFQGFSNSDTVCIYFPSSMLFCVI
ncbi:carcinoembryonic antigen-related cell adhesion molecule 8-like isoform X1 [Mustela nigripes]|uniref:carcinoembryonic antigen-related cell adhesion molecule 8-like isoform X1 n=1 Tax=Mustela nigripes TaxID=77151 RepID=UPI00281549EA|nr:carcinoembryonic antigen-related cell adhesion molecule 8-like isoform X1 [Mustela nigripes]